LACLMVEGYSVTTLSAIRKVIASRMTAASQTIPHFRLGADIQVDALLALRRALNDRFPETPLSINDLFVKACASALMEVPAVNIQWAATEIRQFQSADISVVTALPSGGLSTPIIQGAESKSLWEISREIKNLTARAARNSLKMNEIVGGSFSISNLGMYGVDQFDAIINPPQCAILAVGAAQSRAIVSNDCESRIARMLRVTLSLDHRAIDGATGAAFLRSLRSRVEQPEPLAARDSP
jgi:pyruvate dehydrogenase E2 component (dihydrolipoamide acetyltransferase)